MSMCRLVSYVIGRGCLLWPVCSLDKTLLAFALLHFVLQGQTCLYSRYLLTSYFCIPIPCDEKETFFLVLVLESLVGLHRTIQLQLLQHQWLGYRCGLLRYWMICLGKEERFVVFEIAPKFCISDFIVDYEGYSISSKGSVPTAIDTMVIWIKLSPIPVPFSFIDS